MADWLIGATHQAQADMDELIDTATALASERIATAGYFSPFAVAVFFDGHVEAVQPQVTELDQLAIEDQLAAQWQALAELKDSLRAVAVAMNVTLPNEFRDGIEITAEHQEGTAIGLVVRYKIGDKRIPQFEAPTAYQEDSRIWFP